jgi:cytochrome oxidase assembly protein ShyY1
MSEPGRGIRFDFEWRITLFTIVMLPLLLGLGVWQLDRAQEKAALETSWEARQSQPPSPLDPLWGQTPETLAYLPVLLSGVFLRDQYFLLDNRIYGGTFGYEVLGIMRLANAGGLVLVNRGWVAGDPARLEMPSVPPVDGSVELVGHIYLAPGKPYLLAEQQLDGDWPQLLQAVEMEKILPLMETLGDGGVFPYPVRTNAGEPGALSIDWQVINVSPDKHRAYAAQWFTMALVLLGLFLARSSNIWHRLRSSGDTGTGR